MSDTIFPSEVVSSYTYDQSTTLLNDKIERIIPPTACPLPVPADALKPSRFVLPNKKDYGKQYYTLYKARIAEHSASFKLLLQSIIKNEGHSRSDLTVYNTLTDALRNQPSVIVGITYKDMAQKPSILDDFSYKNMRPDDSKWVYDQGLGAYTNQRNYCNTTTDTLYLEDDQGRVKIIFTPQTQVYNISSSSLSSSLSSSPSDIDPLSNSIPSSIQPQPPNGIDRFNAPMTVDKMVSGMLVGFQGVLLESGEYEATRVFFPCMGFSPSSSSSTTTAANTTDMTDSEPFNEKDTYIAFLSDLNLANHSVPSHPSTDLVLDFLTGASSCPTELEFLSSRIQHVVISGGIIGSEPMQQQADRVASVPPGVSTPPAIDQYGEAPSQIADRVLARIASTCPVTVIPSPTDPTNVAFPMQPLHPCLFPTASTYPNFKCTTNPASFNISVPSTSHSSPSDTAAKAAPSVELVCSGTDGAPIANITKFSCHHPLSALALTFLAQHYCPTTPDTLSSYPFVEHDPMYITNLTSLWRTENHDKDIQPNMIPDIYFTGSMPALQHTTIDVSFHTMSGSFSGPATTAEIPTLHDTITKQVTLLCIPSFHVTSTIILVNTRTKAVIPCYFGTVVDTSSYDMFNSLVTLSSSTVPIVAASLDDDTHAVIDFDLDDDGGDGGD